MSMTRTRVVAGLLMILAAAAWGAAQETAAAKAAPSCPWVAASPLERLHDFSDAAFAAPELTDLVFSVFFPEPLPDAEVVTLKLFTPRGFLYRQLDVPVVEEGASRNPGARTLPNYPHPVPSVALQRVRYLDGEYAAVDLPLPVAGTAIINSSLYGKWSVRVYVDGVEQSCGELYRFEMAQ